MSTEIVVESPTRGSGRRRYSVSSFLDGFFFIFAAVASIWLATLVFNEGFNWGWSSIAFFLVFWALLAYLVLPRLHRILTTIYVPDYFIGRARTSDGLLGDPVNLALLGSTDEIHSALTAAGWTRADEVNGASSLRIISSTITRRSYDEAPVSPLFLFGRQQDVAYQQEVKGNPAKRHHVRFWRCPDGWLLPGGRRVEWLAAGTFDRSVGFSLFTLQITHKIDANTDIERDHIVSTLVDADVGADVTVIKDFSTGYHARNGGGDTIETDGDLPVIDLSGVRVDAQGASVAADADARRLALEERRPVPTALGVLLMVLRVLAGVGYIVLNLLDWQRFVGSELATSAVSADERETVSLVLGVAMGVFAAGLVLYFLLALLVFFGSNWARIAAMSYSALIIAFSAVDFFNGGPQVSLKNNLLGLALDILVLLALSSKRSRLWARRPADGRRRTRPDARAPQSQASPITGTTLT